MLFLRYAPVLLCTWQGRRGFVYHLFFVRFTRLRKIAGRVDFAKFIELSMFLQFAKNTHPGTIALIVQFAFAPVHPAAGTVEHPFGTEGQRTQ